MRSPVTAIVSSVAIAFSCIAGQAKWLNVIDGVWPTKGDGNNVINGKANIRLLAMAAQAVVVVLLFQALPLLFDVGASILVLAGTTAMLCGGTAHRVCLPPLLGVQSSRKRVGFVLSTPRFHNLITIRPIALTAVFLGAFLCSLCRFIQSSLPSCPVYAVPLHYFSFLLSMSRIVVHAPLVYACLALRVASIFKPFVLRKLMQGLGLLALGAGLLRYNIHVIRSFQRVAVLRAVSAAPGQLCASNYSTFIALGGYN